MRSDIDQAFGGCARRIDAVQEIAELLACDCLLILVENMPIRLRRERRELRCGHRKGTKKKDQKKMIRSHMDFLNAFAPSCYKKDP